MKLDGPNDIFDMIRLHWVHRLAESFYIFLFILPSFQPLCFPDTCRFICFLLSLAFQRQTYKLHLLSGSLKDIPEIPRSIGWQTNTTISQICVLFFVVSFFLFVHLLHLALWSLFEFLSISSFYVLLTAKWRQVSRLDQFGRYFCYNQHASFRTPGSNRLQPSDGLTKWASPLSVLTNIQIQACLGVSENQENSYIIFTYLEILFWPGSLISHTVTYIPRIINKYPCTSCREKRILCSLWSSDNIFVTRL